ncbi:MAG: ADP-ribosylglycohydrolase [Lentisphaerae bacterium ADurb.Bin242]|nr:MAG: ADP-ribosylglycohydrolase [Lentisphaerae bacterium ADurb.Bin242]
MIVSGWTTPCGLLKAEFKQRKEEGFLVPECALEAVEKLDGNVPEEAAYEKIYVLLEASVKDPHFPFTEPDELDEIRAERPAPVELPPCPGDPDILLDKWHGAWLGRCVGCALGKPVEGMGMSGGKRHDIKRYLQNRGDWPLSDYFSGRDAGDGLHIGCEPSTREKIAFMESDDDIRYTLTGLTIFERFGTSFTSENIARLWNELLPMNSVCTAERQALLNYNMHLRGWPFDKTFTRRFNNPYREWIGAQIRADFFGFMAPGNPELAAEYAWRDASWTHVKNGIYGEMFIAALEAAAFVEDDPAKLVAAALAQIPENCRLADGIRKALTEIGKRPDIEAFMDWLDLEYPDMSPVHTINNALLCVAALFYGRMNPDRSVCLAVSGGLDTDCNGATVGAITGIVSGFKNFGGSLAGRLHDTVRARFFEFQEIRISELARRTANVYPSNCGESGKTGRG